MSLALPRAELSGGLLNGSLSSEGLGSLFGVSNMKQLTTQVKKKRREGKNRTRKNVTIIFPSRKFSLTSAP
jgi:hypothetical protein